MAKYIVTGCAGFIGSHLTERLLNDGHEVVGIDNLSTGFKDYLPYNPEFTFLEIDISDWSALSKNAAYLKGTECVFHLAACARIQPSIFNPSITHDTNCTGTINVLEIMRTLNIKNIVYSGSSSYYGRTTKIPSLENDPADCQTPYAATKYMGELYCSTWAKTYGLNSARIRYFNVWGPRSPLEGHYAPVVSKFIRQALLEEKPITVVGMGDQKRDFTHIEDVVDANIKASEFLSNNEKTAGIDEVFNIGTGENITILDLAKLIKEKLIEETSGLLNPHIIHIPERIGEATESRACNTKARDLLGWAPKHSIETKLVELIVYYATGTLKKSIEEKKKNA